MEAAVFLCFMGVQLGVHAMPHVWERVEKIVWVQRLSRHHYLVWFVHPAVLHTLQDYVVHFVVYSGHVLRL